MRRFNIIMLVTSIMALSSIVKAEEITFAYGGWKPVIYSNKAGEAKGIYKEIIDAIFVDELGMTVDYIELPWKRAQVNVKRGSADMMITVATQERLSYTQQSEQPFFQLYLNVLTYANHEKLDGIRKIKSVEDILKLNLTVGSNQGNGWVKENIENKGVNVNYVPKDQNILKFLFSRRSDIAIDAPASMNLLIDKLGLQSKIIITEARFGPLNMPLLISKKSKYIKLLPQINRIFAKLVQQGRIDEILRKFKAIR